MRFYEWLTFVFYIAFALLAWKRALPLRRRAMITVNAAAGVAALLLLRSTPLQNWLPLAFIPLAYWQTGYFVLPLNQKLQSRLESFDESFLRSIRLGPHITFWLELAYLLVYPLVPLGLIALYLSGMGQFAEEFWNVVLPPAYLCYATFPFVQTLPPRAIEERVAWEPQRTKIRILNLFVLRHVSIQANTFPSGHVAASLAIALVLLRHAPEAGVLFLIMAIAIAAGAFFGRYHYGLDVLIGAALAVISFLL
jgi:membrane-associated phospholipid phosphatase